MSAQRDPLIRRSDVEAAHALLAEHYGCRVAPVHEFCNAVGDYVTALSAEGAGSPWQHGDGSDPVAEFLRSAPFLMAFATKSNLLWRLLYLGQPLRTKKCPEHDGHWSGCQPEPCPHGCSVGIDVTGWLPDA